MDSRKLCFNLIIALFLAVTLGVLTVRIVQKISRLAHDQPQPSHSPQRRELTKPLSCRYNNCIAGSGQPACAGL